MRKLFLAITILSTACGPFHRGSSGESTVIFNNQTTDQADIYASTSGADPIRIGTVFSGQTSRMTVPATIVGSAGLVTITARLLAGPRVSTGPFSFGSNQTAELRLPSDMKLIVVTAVH